MYRCIALSLAVALALALGGVAGVHGNEPALSAVAHGRNCSDRCDRVSLWRINYVTHDGLDRSAYVVVPAWYDLGDPALPLVIAPHGRGIRPLTTLRDWGDLPALGSFAVVIPDGQGRRLERFSWGYPGQIADLAQMPGIVERELPWLRIDRHRIYAVGTSMGGQESLLLVGRYPHVLAGAVAFDAIADMALRYRDFGSLRCDAACRREWIDPFAASIRALARIEIGGTPETDPRAYAVRSPLTYARAIAFSGVPIELWWSRTDRVVTQPNHQSERLFRRLRGLNPRAPVEGFAGSWAHGTETPAYLPIALAELGLLPREYGYLPADVRFFPAAVWPRRPARP